MMMDQDFLYPEKGETKQRLEGAVFGDRRSEGEVHAP